MRDVALFKGEAVVKINIHGCLRGAALEWYTTELTETEKRLLRNSNLENGWLAELINHFKPRAAEAMAKLQHMSYSYQDI